MAKDKDYPHIIFVGRADNVFTHICTARTMFQLCLSHNHIPIELLRIALQYYLQALDNTTIRAAVSYWFDASKYDFCYLRYGHITEWDTSQVNDMHMLFSNNQKMNANIGGWDVSNVTTMSWMFCGAESFNRSLNDWDVSKVVDMKYMFHSAKRFNQRLDR